MGKKAFVPADIQMRIRLLVDEGVRKAEKHYGIQLPSPKIVYNKTGTTAGTANGYTWTINLNSFLLMQNVEEFIARTPLHELGHLVQFRVYPHTLKPEDESKRSVHGWEWAECCNVVGLSDTKRTHNFDVSQAKKKVDTTRYTYFCLACNADVVMTAKRHVMQVNGTRKYHHTPCGKAGKLVLKQNVKLQMIGTQPIVHVRAPKPVNEGKLGPTSGKIGECWALYKRWKHIYGRKDMIAVFVNEADCTPAGASTYYATCQKYDREGYI